MKPSLRFAMAMARLAWKSTAPAPPQGSITFAAQSTLPSLPVPDLSTTLSRLKDSIRPIAWTDAEHANAVSKIDAFEKSSQSRELQGRLLRRADQTRHWLEEWWDEAAYLGYRDSVVVNVSYYYGFDDHPPHLPQTPAHRAAAITRAAMLYRQRLRCGLAAPDVTKEGPLCMDTYRWMFDCCRVPDSSGLDSSVSYAKETDTGNTGHIVVFRRNRPWKVETTKDGRILGTSELEKQFQYIYDNTTQDYPGVGVLTASNRDTWAQDYTHLSSSSVNASIIQAIHSAAFTISLETSTPTMPVEFSRALWHGELSTSQSPIPIGLRNRWVDKPVQFIIFDNVKAGIMGEHSVMDGTPTVSLCDDVLEHLSNPAFDHGSPPSSSPLPAPLDWAISPTITHAISAADQAAAELIQSQSLGFHLTTYGKAAIKGFGVSPDSWAQMIVQLAYKRLLALSSVPHRIGGTYEAATTRRFYKGRTEAIRVVSTESDAWVASMDDAKVGQVERKRLFDLATKKHVELAKAGGMGAGVDRHLFGLKKMLNEGEHMPAFLDDPVVKRSSYWVLSTSAVFSKHFPVYGWGEVVPDGFGVAYMTGYDDRLQYTVTSRKEMPNAEFMAEIAQASVDLYNLHADVSEAKARL